MKNKLLVIGPVSVHARSFIQFVRPVFKEIVFIGEGDLESPLVDKQYILKPRSINPFKVVARYQQLKKIIVKEQPDVVHIQQINRVAFLAATYLTKTTIPYAVTPWGTEILLIANRNSIAKHMVQKVLSGAFCVTENSTAIAAAVADFGVPKDKVIRAMFGVEPIPFGEKENTIFSNRMLDPLYNIDTIITSFAVFQQENTSWNLVIAGIGELEDSLKQLVNDLGINDKVSFVGWLETEENRMYYQKASIFASFPSSDSTSVSMLEAMSTGCIPVISDLLAPREWVTDSLNGVIRKEGEENVFQRALELDSDKVAKYNEDLIDKFATKEKSTEAFCSVYDRLPENK